MLSRYLEKIPTLQKDNLILNQTYRSITLRVNSISMSTHAPLKIRTRSNISPPLLVAADIRDVLPVLAVGCAMLDQGCE